MTDRPPPADIPVAMIDPSPAAPPLPVEPLAYATWQGDAEAIRRSHLDREAELRNVASLFVFGGVILVAAAIVNIIAESWRLNAQLWTISGLLLLLGGLQILTGWKLYSHTRWARTPAAVLCLAWCLATFPIGLLVSGYALYLLFSKKGSFVFSEQYVQIKALTPHVRMKTALAVKILGIIVAVLLIALLIARPFLG